LNIKLLIIEVAISDQAKGIYLLSIISDNEKIDRKIVLK